MIDNSTYAVLDPEFWAPLDQKTVTPEFRGLVGRVLGDGWSVIPGGVWTHYHPPAWSGARQGWKLHVSATPANAREVLERVAAVLRDDPAAFKTAADAQVLSVLLSKNWPREGGGKFVTVYPADEAHFQRLGRALATATEGLDGPYILSDRRVPGSRIVFYRYGEHLPTESLDPRGFRVHHVVAPDGGQASDRRRGYYQHPDWVEDPYGARPVQVIDTPQKKVTLAGRFEVQGALAYSNMGGIYHAHDLERDAPVVVRERRPCTGWIDPQTDAVALLKKEARILRTMDGTGWTPAFVAEFGVWEHHYVAMERVRGTMLRDFALSRYFARKSIASPRRLFQVFRHLVLELVRGVEAFHERGIIVRDLTVNNVIVRPDRSLCFIDFEYAWERDGGQAFAAKIHTPGFASPEQVAGHAPTEGDDFHALGAVVVELCAMLAPGLGLNRAGVFRAAEMMMDEVGLPRALLEVARGLMDPDPAARWDGDAVRRALGAVRASTVPWTPREPAKRAPGSPGARPREGVQSEVAEACEAVCRFFETAASPERDDRLWPASPEAHQINAVCIQFGACGPVEYVRRVRGAVPEAWLDWVERRATPGRCPPGLFVGRAGVAATLAACGRADAARRLIREAVEETPLPHASLYHGAAGVGVAALALADAVGEPALRDAAVEIGDGLARRAVRRTRGIAWPNEDGSIPCGLASGGSGVSLFYTYLGAATGEARWWELARRALEWELAQVSWSAGYAFWPAARYGRRKSYRSPHVSFGTAGVAMAAARLYACTGDASLLPWLEHCAEMLSFRWTNKLWHDMGYAGIGETLLDLHAATGDERHRIHALRTAEALLPHQVRTRLGTAFPGGGLNRVAADFGMGASGVALFLHRLVHGGHRAFFPDHLLPGWPAAAPASIPSSSIGAGSIGTASTEPGSTGSESTRTEAGPIAAYPTSASSASPAPAGSASILVPVAAEGLSGGSGPGTSDGGGAPRPAGRARAKGRARTPA